MILKDRLTCTVNQEINVLIDLQILHILLPRNSAVQVLNIAATDTSLRRRGWRKAGVHKQFCLLYWICLI